MTLIKADLADVIFDECWFMRGDGNEIVKRDLESFINSLLFGKAPMISEFGK